MHGLTSSILALATATLALLAQTSTASASSQFNLSPSGGDISACWYKCHQTLTSDSGLLPGIWSASEVNSPVFVTKNCMYDEYLTLMGECLIEACATTYDVAYAVEYGAMICKKSGVDAVISVPPSYTSTAGGYYATGTALSVSAANDRTGSSLPAILGAGGAVLVGVIGGMLAL